MIESLRRHPVAAFVGLGSNLDGPRRHVARALAELDDLPHSTRLAASALYRTRPVGPQDQPDYINAVAALETRLMPRDLLAALQGIERRHGRVRDGSRWGPRTLDLDLLLYGDEELDVPGLHIPHPQMHRRAFVLVPLADVAAASLVVPGRGRVGQLLAQVDNSGIERVPATADAGEAAAPELC